MSKTNIGLLEYAKAQVGKPYWYGCYGQTASQSLYNSKKASYPRYYTASDFTSQYGQRVHDCSGLIKGYLWSATTTSSPVYNATQDLSAKGMYSNSGEKGKIASLPNVDGILVFKGTFASLIHHVGVYSKDGYVYEAKGHEYGVVCTPFKASEWNFWAKHKDIEYNDEEITSEETATSEVVAVKPASYYDASLAGQYKVVNCTELNLRNGAGKSYKSLACIPAGKVVRNYGYYSVVSNVKWLYVQITYNNVKYTGFMSSSYLEKV